MATTLTPRFEARGLALAYGQRQVLQGLSLAVAPGQMLALLGPNGAGKSTAFRVLVGLEKPASGSFCLDGETVLPTSGAFRRHVGVVFQSPSLDDMLTAQENLVAFGGLFGMGRKACQTRAAELMELVGLTDRASERAKTFSGGMRRRLELARVLMHRPKLLLLDEPTQGLDMLARRQIWQHLQGLCEQDNVSLVVATHLADEATRCHNVAVMHEGKVAVEGPPRQLCEALGGQVLRMRCQGAGALKPKLSEYLKVEVSAVGEELVAEVAGAYELIPPLVQTFSSQITAISVSEPTLDDVFFRATGQSIQELEGQGLWAILSQPFGSWPSGICDAFSASAAG